MIAGLLPRVVLLCCCLWPFTVNAEKQSYFVIGDTGDCDLPGTALVAKAMAAQAAPADSTLIELGDLAYPVATRERLQACHEPYFAGYRRRLAVPGNHDWYDRGGAGFFEIFPQPVPRKEVLNDRWRLLLLNSNLRDDAWQNQLTWLDRALAASNGECLIAVWHHPRWSSGRHGDGAFTQPLWQRLAGRASLTLHGHDHHFEAIAPLDATGQPASDGLPSFVVGHGGATLYGAGSGPQRGRPVYGQYGFMRLELDGTSYRWQAIGSEGQVLDQGAGQCRPTAPLSRTF